MEICEEQNYFETTFEAEGLSAAFSGEGSHTGLAGIFGNFSDCYNCELRLECHWNAAEKSKKKLQLKKKYRETKFQLQIFRN